MSKVVAIVLMGRPAYEFFKRNALKFLHVSSRRFNLRGERPEGCFIFISKPTSRFELHNPSASASRQTAPQGPIDRPHSIGRLSYKTL